MIDETKSHIPCWLVWSTSEKGNVTLEAISLIYSHAKYTKKVLLDGRKEIISVKIEPSECNHMFAVDLDSKWLESYGKDSSKRFLDFHTEVIRKDLTMAKKIATKIIRAVGNKNDEEIRKSILEWINIFGLYQE
jgi:hypothetical protein